MQELLPEWEDICWNESWAADWSHQWLFWLLEVPKQWFCSLPIGPQIKRFVIMGWEVSLDMEKILFRGLMIIANL